MKTVFTKPFAMARRTSDVGRDQGTKTLVYGIHGAGKTTQFAHYQDRFGPGLLISGEAGLRSIADKDIDYIPFSSWDGTHDPSKNIFSFKGIMAAINTKEFADAGYSWIGVDSLTELGDRLYEYLEANPSKWATKRGEPNPLELWGLYGTSMIAAMKWIRDLPYHVLVTALSKDETTDTGSVEYWPSIKGKAAARQIPGVFDYVFGLVRMTKGDPSAPTVRRFVVTDEVRGWKGKTRLTESRRIPPFIETGDITEILAALDYDDTKFAEWLAKVSPSESK